MEENKNNQQSRAKLNFSIVLSFCVAVFAIISLIAVGFDQVSYAAETPSDSSRNVLDTFIFNQKKVSDTQNYMVTITGSDGETFGVPIYYRVEGGKNIPVFCVEHDIYTSHGATYTRYTANGGVPAAFSSDMYYGVLYILSKSKSVDSNASGISGTTGIVEDFSTQLAIWAYLYDMKGGVSPHSFIMNDEAANPTISTAKRNVIRTFTTYQDNAAIGSSEVTAVSGLSSKIESVVQQAKSATKERKLEINYSNRNLSITSDKNYYLSSEFSVSEVTGSGSLVSYDVEATGIDGVKVINDKGEEKTTFAPAEKFFIRVPVDKVPEGVKNINIKVTGTFDGVLLGTYYTSPNLQTVVTVTNTTVADDDSLVLEVTKSPDTSMNSVQTIYFIGLIVLLCGIGIIYANAKPVEEK